MASPGAPLRCDGGADNNRSTTFGAGAGPRRDARHRGHSRSPRGLRQRVRRSGSGLRVAATEGAAFAFGHIALPRSLGERANATEMAAARKYPRAPINPLRRARPCHIGDNADATGRRRSRTRRRARRNAARRFAHANARIHLSRKRVMKSRLVLYRVLWIVVAATGLAVPAWSQDSYPSK